MNRLRVVTAIAAMTVATSVVAPVASDAAPMAAGATTCYVQAKHVAVEHDGVRGNLYIDTGWTRDDIYSNPKTYSATDAQFNQVRSTNGKKLKRTVAFYLQYNSSSAKWVNHTLSTFTTKGGSKESYLVSKVYRRTNPQDKVRAVMNFDGRNYVTGWVPVKVCR